VETSERDRASSFREQYAEQLYGEVDSEDTARMHQKSALHKV